jgi:hypothetical protein
MKNKFFIILSFFLFFLKLNAQTTKKIEICFFDEQNNPVNNVEIDIVCGYCDSSEIIFSDTNNCIYFEFLCDKIYFVNLYHIGLYTIKDIIRNPCDLEKKEYYFEKIKQSSH